MTINVILSVIIVVIIVACIFRERSINLLIAAKAEETIKLEDINKILVIDAEVLSNQVFAWKKINTGLRKDIADLKAKPKAKAEKRKETVLNSPYCRPIS